jgi:hypothetical protein
MSGRYKITTDMDVRLVGTIHAMHHEIELELTFDIHPGIEESRLQPGEPASVSICTAYVIERDGIYVARHEAPTWLWRMIEGDDALEIEMLAEAWEADEAARDYRAEAIREDRMLERGQ